jgi:signal transduction histidine kinase
MKIYKLILTILFFYTCQFANSQEEYSVQESFKKLKFDSFIKVFKTPDSIILTDFFKSKNIKWEDNKVSYGFSTDFYWLKFSLKNATSFTRELYFEINNPHIKYIEFYKLVGEELKLEFRCGDYLPYNTRPIDSEKFIFPIRLEANESALFLIKIDKRNTSISFPTYLIDTKEFIKINNASNLINGILFGGIILCVLYSIIAFFYIKRLLFLWYSLYAISLGLYLFTTLGYSFQYLYPNNVIFTSFFRIVMLILGVIFLLKFTQSLLKTNLYIKKIHFIINGIIYGLMLVLLVWLLFPNFYKLHITFMVKAVYFFMLLSIISFFLAAFLTFTKQKSIVKLYFISFGSIIFCGSLALLLEFGIGQEIRLNIPFLLIGALAQIIILGIGLFYEIALIYKEKNNLVIKVAKKKQEIVQAYVDGMEKERLRVSNELHDNIGSQLANIVRYVDYKNIQLNEFHEKLKSVIDDVRRISHELTTFNRNFSSFKERFENLLEETFLNEKIKCEFQFNGAAIILNERQELCLYRIIQEILNNIAKHSKATLVEIQFMNFENEITLTIEDNGIGFNTQYKGSGIGLTNVKRRVNYLKGTMELSSVKGKGTFFTFSIPLD